MTTCANCLSDLDESALCTTCIDDELERLKAERDRCEDIVNELRDWANEFGEELCPGMHPDTFGAGVHETKRKLARTIDHWKRSRKPGRGKS